MDEWLPRGLLAQGGDLGHGGDLGQEGDLGRFLRAWLPRAMDCLKPLGMMGDSGGVLLAEWRGEGRWAAVGSGGTGGGAGRR